VKLSFVIVFIFTGPPAAPVSPIQLLQVTRDSVTIQWDSPLDDGGAKIKHYIIEKRETSRRMWVRCGQTDADVRTICIPNLMEGHVYAFRVSAENRYGVGEPLETETPITVKRVFGEYNIYNFQRHQSLLLNL
jgi:titin